MFVVLEGLDGVAKTTLCAKLAQHYQGLAVNTPGTLLKPWMPALQESFNRCPIARCLFYASTVFAEGESAYRKRAQGVWVFMDRYWLSTWAYAQARGVAVDMESLEQAVPVPDLTILLTLDEEERQRRLHERGDITLYEKETFDAKFRHSVLHNMQNPRRSALKPISLDITGLNRYEVAVEALAMIRRHVGDPPCPVL